MVRTTTSKVINSRESQRFDPRQGARASFFVDASQNRSIQAAYIDPLTLRFMSLSSSSFEGRLALVGEHPDRRRMGYDRQTEGHLRALYHSDPMPDFGRVGSGPGTRVRVFRRE